MSATDTSIGTLRRNDYKGDAAIEALKLAQAAIEEVLNENAKLRRALVELDTGGEGYLSTREKVAELSGLGVMACVFDEHIAEIKRKLEAACPRE
jgi:hypothetical protein